MHIDWRVSLGAQATHQDVGLRMRVGLLRSDVAAFDQQLHIRVVKGLAHQLAIVEVVHPRVTGMCPVAIATCIDDKGGKRAVWLFLG